MLEKLKVAGPPCPNRPGVLGHGECLKYDNHFFYYRVGKHLPKDKAVSLNCEDGYCGRVNGEKQYIVVAWDGQDFVLLDHVYDYGVNKILQKYKNKSNLKAIKIKEDQLRKVEEEQQRIRKIIGDCKYCGASNSI